MGFPQSPGVVTKEFDLTTIVPSVATTEGALGGVFRWGPLEQIVQVTDENNLVDRFGKPTNLNPETFFTGGSFLAYSNQLYVARAANAAGVSPIVSVTTQAANATVIVASGNTLNLATGMILARAANNQAVLGATITSIVNSTAFTVSSASQVVAGGTDDLQFVSNSCVFTAVATEGVVANLAAQIVKNEDHYSTKDGTFDTDVLYVARCPGAIGDSLRISVCDTANAFYSVVNLAAVSDGSTISLSVGSNVATVIVTNNHDGTSNSSAQTAVIADALTLKGNFQVTDLMMFGNTSDGTQALKITAIGNTTSTVNGTVAAATFTFSYEDELRLIADQVLSTTVERYWEFSDYVDAAPGQTDFVLAQGNGAAYDELHVIVVDDKGLFTSVPGTVLEAYKGLSRATDAVTPDNETNYYKTVINTKSKYIWWAKDRTTALSNTALNVTSASNTSVLSLVFKYGYDGSDENTIALSNMTRAYDQFQNKEEIDISLILTGKSRGGAVGAQLANYLIDNIAEIRQDCVVFVSPDKFDVVSNKGDEADDIVDFRNALRDSSYGVLDSGYKYMYDKYNDLYRWIPLNGDVAGLCVRTDATNDPWWSPAGFNRGQIKNIVKLAWNPKEAERNTLYKSGANPVVSFPGMGIVLYGDKTLQAKPSAFDRINVRRLFIVLRKAISRAARYSLFEFNDTFTRAQFRNMVTPYLRDIQGRRGIYDFQVVCNETNNPGVVIDRNEFIADIYIKPSRSINYITLNFIAVPTGVNFSEVVGKF